MPENYDFLQPVLGEELYTQVAEKLNSAENLRLVNVADGSYIPKAKFDETNSAVKSLKASLAEANAKLNSQTETVSSVEALNSQIAALNAEIEKVRGESAESEKHYRIARELQTAGAKNPEALVKMIDLRKIEMKDGKLKGLQEQVEALKKSDGYMFADAPGSKGGFSGSQNISGGASLNELMNAALRKAVGRN